MKDPDPRKIMPILVYPAERLQLSSRIEKT